MQIVHLPARVPPGLENQQKSSPQNNLGLIRRCSDPAEICGRYWFSPQILVARLQITTGGARLFRKNFGNKSMLPGGGVGTERPTNARMTNNHQTYVSACLYALTALLYTPTSGFAGRSFNAPTYPHRCRKNSARLVEGHWLMQQPRIQGFAAFHRQLSVKDPIRR